MHARGVLTTHLSFCCSVACRGGCGRCDGPGHPTWGHPRGQFL